MFAFGIRYLNGFVVASEPDSRERVEWPPHPARVFMALAAAHFQTGAEPAERRALEWLERLDEQPCIRAGIATPRSLSSRDGRPVEHYVPVNDKSGPAKALLQDLPLSRDRQPRRFAQGSLNDEIVHFVWATTDAPGPVRSALEALCTKVTRIGHSTSLVQMWVASGGEIGEPNWLPDDNRAIAQLRIPGAGSVAELERRYNANAVDIFAELQVASADDADRTAQRSARKRLKDEFPDGAPTQLRPEFSLYQGYASAEDVSDEAAAPGSVLDPHLIVRILEREDGPYRHLDLVAVPAVAQRWREAILSMSNDAPEQIRELLSGHDRRGAPLGRPHLAFVPLAFAGHPHADGRLLGMALALPRGLPPGDRRAALRVIGRVEQLALGRLGKWRLAADTAAQPAWNLRPATWTGYPHGATHWSTVTPVVFDRHPKAKNRASYQCELAAMIAESCVRVGLPEPREVIVTPVSAHLGVPPAHAFPRLKRKDGSERRHAHAILVFGEAVCGPVVIGAGRYRGYGVGRGITSERHLV